MENGQITRFVEVANAAGEWELAVEVFTENGLVLGHLFAPTNAAEGVARFKPDPELQHLAGAHAADRQAEPEAPNGGALTTSEVPTTGKREESGKAKDPNDPRGLRHGRR